MEDKRATLQDIINYEQETYINENDIALIRSTFKDNPRLFRVLRKIFLPSIGDVEMPVEEISKDAWLYMTDWNMIPDGEIKSLIVARQEAIKFVAGGLIQLKIIANTDAKSITELANLRKQNSTK